MCFSRPAVIGWATSWAFGLCCNFMFFGYTWFIHKQKTESVLGKPYFFWVRQYLPRLDYHENLSLLNLSWMWVTRSFNTDKLNCNIFILRNVKSNVPDCYRSVFGKVQMADLFFKSSFIVWKNNTVGYFYLCWQSFKPYHLLVVFCEEEFHSSSIARYSCRTLKRT